MIRIHFRARGINSEWVFGRKGLAKRSKKSDQCSFRMLNQFAVETPTLPVEQCHSHLIQFLKEFQAVFFGMPSHREGPPGICDTHGTSKNVFCKLSFVMFSTLSSRIESVEFIYRRSRSIDPQWRKVKREKQDQDLRCQSGPSAKNSSRPTTTADFRSSFWQIPCTNHICLLEDKIQDRGMYLPTFFFTEAVQWITEVEMVDPVGDL